MSDKLRIPGLSADDASAIAEMWDQLGSKRERNSRRVAYFDGKKNLRHWAPVIPGEYVRLGNVLGWTSKAVMALVRRTNIDGFTWADGDLDDLDFRAIAKANALLPTLGMARVDSAKMSTAFLVSTQGEDGEPPALLHAKTALTATGIWSHRTRSLSAGLSIDALDDKGKASAISVYMPGRTGTSERTGSRWSEMIWTEHDYGMPMFAMPYQPDLTRPFGRSRISREMMGIQDSAARAVCRLEGHMDAYSWPELWIRGGSADDTLDDAGTTLEAMAKRVGRIRGIPDNEDADPALARVDLNHFPAADPKPHLDQLKAAAQMFSGMASIPLTSLGFSDTSNPTSADSYIASREDLIAEAEGATDDWTGPIMDATQALVRMWHGEPNMDLDSLAPKWRSPMYLSRAAKADAGQKQLAAMPWLADTEVGLELIGLDEPQITRALAERRRAQGRAAIATLAGLAPESE